RYQDLWQSLLTTFRLFEDARSGEPLDLKPLAGDLFSAGAMGLIEQCRLSNEVFLTCLRRLCVFRNPITDQITRVSYAALNVEEFGSVYEGLLEFDADVRRADNRFVFSFVQGGDRAASGSHYTPD